MKRQGHGAVVNTSSLAGIMGAPGMSPYVMSKYAVVGLTRGVRWSEVRTAWQLPDEAVT